MAAVMFILFGAGGLLVAAGCFGRRRDDHPWCVKCRHDLFGVSDTTRCVECGADLTRRRAMRRGHWRKRPPLIALGAALLLVCAALAASETWGWARDVKWDEHKPMWWLMRSARADTAETRQAALEELHRRAQLDEVSSGRILALAEMGLAFQGDESIEWEPLWGTMIDAAIRRGLLSDEQVHTYLDGAVSFELDLAPGPLSGRDMRGDLLNRAPSAPTPFTSSQWDCIELNLRAKWRRCALNEYYDCILEVSGVSLGDVEMPASLYRDPENSNQITLSRVYGYPEEIVPSIPVVVPPGEYEVRASVQLEIFVDDTQSVSLRTLDLELRAPIVVTAASADAAEIVIDEVSTQLVREAARITLVGLRRLPDLSDPDAAGPGLICSVSSGKRNWFGLSNASDGCPVQADLDISVYAGGEYINTMSVSLPDSSTFDYITTPDLTPLDLVVRPSTYMRSSGGFDAKTGNPKPRWMGPEFTVHIDDVPWYDSIDDPACPREYREMTRSFLEMSRRPPRRSP